MLFLTINRLYTIHLAVSQFKFFFEATPQFTYVLHSLLSRSAMYQCSHVPNQPVRWEESIRNMIASLKSDDIITEVGPQTQINVSSDLLSDCFFLEMRTHMESIMSFELK